jgi:hypothetical protein
MLCVAADYEEDELRYLARSWRRTGIVQSSALRVVPMTYDAAIERAVNWDEFPRERGLPARAEPPGSRPVGC